VFFLEPPVAGMRTMTLTPAADHRDIQIIRYGTSIPPAVRIHLRPAFDLIFGRKIAEIRKIVAPVDIVWCFEINLFSDLRKFGAELSLFHPVDKVSEKEHVNVGRSADAILSVSDRILSAFSDLPVPSFVINHGLAPEFERLARREPPPYRRPRTPRVGYVGNLARPAIDRDVISTMVRQNTTAEFHFWGPYHIPEGSDLRSVSDIREFIRFLGSSANVVLHGTKRTEELAVAIQDVDCFLLSYAYDAAESDRSNSHKLLEYLSTGKVVVSSRISTYADKPDLMRMPEADEDSALPAMLADTLSRLDELNAAPLQRMRREFALEFTYAAQLDRVIAVLDTPAKQSWDGHRAAQESS
jgi:glycosyltransferase involved in cell wall biosynthesis